MEFLGQCGSSATDRHRRRCRRSRIGSGLLVRALPLDNQPARRVLTLLMTLPRSAPQSESPYSGRKTETVEWPRAPPAAAQSQARRAGRCGLMMLGSLLRSPPSTHPWLRRKKREREGERGKLGRSLAMWSGLQITSWRRLAEGSALCRRPRSRQCAKRGLSAVFPGGERRAVFYTKLRLKLEGRDRLLMVNTLWMHLVAAASPGQALPGELPGWWRTGSLKNIRANHAGVKRSLINSSNYRLTRRFSVTAAIMCIESDCLRRSINLRTDRTTLNIGTIIMSVANARSIASDDSKEHRVR